MQTNIITYDNIKAILENTESSKTEKNSPDLTTEGFSLSLIS